MSTLVILESPGKVKTVQKYLGSGYEVVASVGHVRDLPKSLLGVDVEHDFKPRYVDLPGKSALIRELKSKARDSDGVLLATDPDREGEAIAWHLAQLLGVNLEESNRVTFNEITQNGVAQGMAHPRTVDMDLVGAQQARRILDRIVGYKLSPFLWQKIRKGLSAGRVQSAVTALVVAREHEIRAFVSEEYWTIEAKLKVGGGTFVARLYGDENGKLAVTNGEQADAILAEVRPAPFQIGVVKKGTRKLTPAPPFDTASLQQEASRKLGFSARRTMKTAQELYEGVDVEGMGAVGLITYMRTDSLRISDDARREGCAYIEERYGARYLPEKPHEFKSKGSAQDAHEAVRPSTPALTPDRVKGSLSADQYKLYKLIWERFTASLMAHCVQDTVQADIHAGRYVFRASGHTVQFDGYTALYEEGKDEVAESKEDDKAEGGALPPLQSGDGAELVKAYGNQHFTQPPPRYTEATLVRTMKDNGIGRPSTYAPTIGTILAREYIEREGKALKPTVLGEITTGLMQAQFPSVVDVDFTARMEEQMDEVESGKLDWVTLLDRFYTDFAQALKRAEVQLSGEKLVVPEVESDVVCELCGRRMVIKSGRYGKFLACPGYPDCKNTKKIVEETPGVCPKCGRRIVAKKSQKGRRFYGCEGYPDCDFVTWSEPSDKLCPLCGKTLFKRGGKSGTLYCLTEGCEGTLDN